ncbi:VOC family protein [Paenibacillus koleovorans]|uniref:VOC family protein n=1 Tax=Paenibacillus koleovorans TaxID=121608 RepID=UPI000FD7B32A|nr:hypothetical protein [Paenibacillus koleovorans]
MSHPISPFIPAVFVPVRDLKSATEWYAALLERQLVPREYTDGIYVFDFGGTSLILDSHFAGKPPMTMFDTSDAAEAHQLCAGLPHSTLSEVFSDEFLSVFTIDTAMMICQVHRLDDQANPKPPHALLSKISHVLVHTDEMAGTVGKYEQLIGRPATADTVFEEMISIRMDKGPDLLFDDNRLSRSPSVWFDSVQQELRVHPIAILETGELDSVLDRMLSRGASVPHGIETRLGVRCFVFGDPDGNEFMVRESTAAK